MSYRAFWQRRCRAAAAGAVLKPQGGNCAVLPLIYFYLFCPFGTNQQEFLVSCLIVQLTVFVYSIDTRNNFSYYDKSEPVCVVSRFAFSNNYFEKSAGLSNWNLYNYSSNFPYFIGFPACPLVK